MNTKMANMVTKMMEPTLDTVINNVLNYGIDLNEIIVGLLGTDVILIDNLKVQIENEYIMTNIMPRFNPNPFNKRKANTTRGNDTMLKSRKSRKLSIDLSHLSKDLDIDGTTF